MTWNTLSKTFIESSMPSEQSLRLEVGGIKGCRPPQDLTKFGNRTPGGGERFRLWLRAVGSGQHEPRRLGVTHRKNEGIGAYQLVHSLWALQWRIVITIGRNGERRR